MKLAQCRRITVVVLLPILLLSCSPSVYREVYPTLLDGKYDSEFPYKGCSKQLEEIGATVKMLTSIAYYKSFPFSETEKTQLSNITPEILRGKSREAVYINNSATGTATVVYYQDRRIALLTCAHVVAFPETLVSYFIGSDRHSTGFVRTIAIKEKQSNFVAVLPEGGGLEILAIDESADIAILGRRFETEPSMKIPVFSYPLGRARELEWGTFVYLFGFPSGYKMVTKGIVSSPNRGKYGSFLVDAVFSRGVSGGIVLAIRDGVPNFELVGIVKLVSAHSEYVLTPGKDNGGIEYDPGVPYTGDIYVERKTGIDYGITQSISIEAIRDFVQQHKEMLAEKGYYLTMFLGPT